VAPAFTSLHQLGLLEKMKNSVESLLATDHESLGQLLNELDEELLKPNISRASELLDLCQLVRHELGKLPPRFS
jgi:hypothetical protein